MAATGAASGTGEETGMSVGMVELLTFTVATPVAFVSMVGTTVVGTTVVGTMVVGTMVVSSMEVGTTVVGSVEVDSMEVGTTVVDSVEVGSDGVVTAHGAVPAVDVADAISRGTTGRQSLVSTRRSASTQASFGTVRQDVSIDLLQQGGD